MVQELKPCGTTAAALRHWRRGEPLCDACTAARRDHQREYHSEKRERAELQPCGTPAAFKRHRLRGETPCQACREAFAAYRKELRERSAGPDRRGPGRPRTVTCGSAGGYRAHLRDGSVPCRACCDAVAAYQRDYRARRRAKAAVGKAA